MKKVFHTQITRQALQEYFSERALLAIVLANLQQDALAGQMGHPEFHFDENCFSGGKAYMDEQRRMAFLSLQAGDAPAAWACFGRLTHAAQDFYAHSNYVALWLEKYPQEPSQSPEVIDPLDPPLLASPALHSGRLYYPLELLSFIPPLAPWVRRLLPRDSHAWMNLDGPDSGPLFHWAYTAACKRTGVEYSQFLQDLPPEARQSFTG